MVSVGIDSDVHDLKVNSKWFTVVPLDIFGWICHLVHHLLSALYLHNYLSVFKLHVHLCHLHCCDSATNGFHLYLMSVHFGQMLKGPGSHPGQKTVR